MYKYIIFNMNRTGCQVLALALFIIVTYSTGNIYCKTWNGTICTECYPGYINLNSVCVVADQLCATLNQANGLCLTCYRGYDLKDDGLCYVAIVNSTIPINTNVVSNSSIPSGSGVPTNNTVPPVSGGGVPSTNATNPFCSRWLNICYCVDCYLGYYIQNGICVLVNPLCKTYDVNTGFCMSCYVNYALQNNTCVPIPPANVTVPATNTTNSSNTTVPCDGPPVVVPPINGGGTNTTTPNATIPNATIPNATIPNATIPNTTIPNTSTPNTTIPNATVPINNTNIYCSNFTAGICVNCYVGYYLQNSICVEGNQLCATIDINSGLCLTCYVGYYLSPAGLCLLTQQLCATVDQYGSCTNCYVGYYLSQGQCHIANILCKTYDFNTGLCLTCWEEYGLINGLCIISPYDVHNGTSGAVTPPDVLPPVVVTPPVVTPPVVTPPVVVPPNGYCSGCVSGYQLINGVCVIVPPVCTCTSGSSGPSSGSSGSSSGSSSGHSSSSNSTSGSSGSSSSGVTIQSTSYDNAFCANFSGAYCSACFNGYYLGSGICKLANNLCETLDQFSGDCLTCYSGYKIYGITCIIA